MTLDIETLQVAAKELEANGISLTFGGHIAICADDIPAVLSDSELFCAKANGVSRDVYIDYINGAPARCSGTTSKGRRCKHRVNGGGSDSIDIKTYAQLLGGYCVFHGG